MKQDFCGLKVSCDRVQHRSVTWRLTTPSDKKMCFMQGCQIVNFQSHFWRALVWNMFVYFMAIWNILQPFGITYCRLV
jgi:hypothetical protein